MVMNVSSYDSSYEMEPIQFLMDKFRLDKSNAVKILKNTKTKEKVLDLFNLYLNLRVHGYDLTPLNYSSSKTIEAVLKMLTIMNREILLNPQLSENKRRTLLCILSNLDLETEIKNENYVIIADRFTKRINQFTRKFVRVFDEIQRIMQIDEKELAGLFESVASEVQSSKNFDELMESINSAEKILKRCKTLDIMKKIKESASSTLWSRKDENGEWYDEEIKEFLIRILGKSNKTLKRTLKSKECNPTTIVRAIIEEDSNIWAGSITIELPREVLAPFIQFIETQVDRIEKILHIKLNTQELLTLSKPKIVEIERDLERIQSSLRIDLETAPWEVIINAKRLDELKQEICSSIRHEVELRTTANIEALLEVVRHLEEVCPKAKPVIRIEFKRRD